MSDPRRPSLWGDLVEFGKLHARSLFNAEHDLDEIVKVEGKLLKNTVHHGIREPYGTHEP